MEKTRQVKHKRILNCCITEKYKAHLSPLPNNPTEMRNVLSDYLEGNALSDLPI